MNERQRSSNREECEACFGMGQYVIMRPGKLGIKLPGWEPCPVCKGGGLKAEEQSHGA